MKVAFDDGLHAGELVRMEAQMDHYRDMRLKQRVALDAGEEDSAVHEVDVVQNAYMRARAGVLRACRDENSLQHPHFHVPMCQCCDVTWDTITRARRKASFRMEQDLYPHATSVCCVGIRKTCKHCQYAM